MPPGKAAAQAIHATLDTLASAKPDIQELYLAEGHGPVIVLVARDEVALQELKDRCAGLGLTCALFIDERADGSPSVTALGVGPVMPEEGRCVMEGLPLMK